MEPTSNLSMLTMIQQGWLCHLSAHLHVDREPDRHRRALVELSRPGRAHRRADARHLRRAQPRRSRSGARARRSCPRRPGGPGILRGRPPGRHRSTRKSSPTSAPSGGSRRWSSSKRPLWILGTVGVERAVHRALRHRRRHHQGLPQHGGARERRLRGRRGRHFRGARRDGARPRRRDRRPHLLQLLPGPPGPHRVGAHHRHGASGRSLPLDASAAPESRGSRMAFAKLPPSGRSHIMADINITPLTDIFLVLLIIFMVTSVAMVDTGAKVMLPEVDQYAERAARDHDHGDAAARDLRQRRPRRARGPRGHA